MINRWIDDLDTPDSSMDGASPLPNQNKNKVSNLGPWLHRLLVISTILITIFFQEYIKELLELVNIINNIMLVIIQFIIIIIFWGIFHKILQLS